MRFEALYARHSRAISAYCARRLSSDQVADAVADAFLVAWRRIDSVPDGDDERLWLYRVAHRTVGRRWRTSRRQQRLRTRLSSQRSLDEAGPEETAIDNSDIERVLTAASRLKPTDAEVLRLSLWEHLSPTEIGAVLDIAPNAVHQRLHRARHHLIREFGAVQRTGERAGSASRIPMLRADPGVAR